MCSFLNIKLAHKIVGNSNLYMEIVYANAFRFPIWPFKDSVCTQQIMHTRKIADPLRPEPKIKIYPWIFAVDINNCTNRILHIKLKNKMHRHTSKSNVDCAPPSKPEIIVFSLFKHGYSVSHFKINFKLLQASSRLRIAHNIYIYIYM